MTVGPPYMDSTRTAQSTFLLTVTLFLRVTQPLLSNGYFSGSTIFALSKYVTIISAFTELYLHRSQKAYNI
jgi:hypothetical protein